MKYREDTYARKQILDALRPDISQPGERSPHDEPHVTELIYCLTKGYWNRFSPGFQSGIVIEPTDKEVLVWGSGTGLESILLRSHKQNISGVYDGVKYAEDVIFNFGPEAEMKTTRIHQKNLQLDESDARLPEGYRKQMLSYMKVRGISEMLLVIWHLIDGELKVWRVNADQADIDFNWSWMQSRRDIFKAFIDDGEPPTPFKYNEDWECNGCRYKMYCEAWQTVLATGAGEGKQ